MKLESKKVSVNSSIEKVFEFLKDTNNIFELMPKDKISDWKSDELSCSFKVQGGIMISFEQTELVAPNKIFLKSGVKSPFPFKLEILLEKQGELTEGYLSFDGEVNLFLKMLVETPLDNLFNFMAEKLKEYYA